MNLQTQDIATEYIEPIEVEWRVLDQPKSWKKLGKKVLWTIIFILVVLVAKWLLEKAEWIELISFY